MPTRPSHPAGIPVRGIIVILASLPALVSLIVIVGLVITTIPFRPIQHTVSRRSSYSIISRRVGALPNLSCIEGIICLGQGCWAPGVATEIDRHTISAASEVAWEKTSMFSTAMIRRTDRRSGCKHDAKSITPTQFRRGNRSTRAIMPSFTFHTTNPRALFREIEKDSRWAAVGCALISCQRPGASQLLVSPSRRSRQFSAHPVLTFPCRPSSHSQSARPI